MKKIICFALLIPLVSAFFTVKAQERASLRWIKADSLFGSLPSSVHVYSSHDPLDGKPSIAYYVIADLSDKKLHFTVDTTLGRRLTPLQFYKKNEQPAIVVNCTFFSFATNQNLNTVIKDGKQVGYTIHTIAGKGKDTLTYRHPLGSALGITAKRKADIAWLYTDSSSRWPSAWDYPVAFRKDSSAAFHISYKEMKKIPPAEGSCVPSGKVFKKWKMETAVGGGPVLVKDGKVCISNNAELKFTGNAINDKHPRTAMGYTRDNKLIILVVEGRNPGIAEGATLIQQAKILADLGCMEALNLDGGGSSCLLVNGKETILPSDKGNQRPVPAVFIIK
ncbi:MAG TPA: phosphodiester glycosidase family protein [Chitinophagaceae bacterium]|nr:phosphodiester glycosidase family protein [Chitinophagaceae bacterium]